MILGAADSGGGAELVAVRTCEDCGETVGPGERRRRCSHCGLYVCGHCWHHVHALTSARAKAAAR